jgi:hypothetical protein
MKIDVKRLIGDLRSLRERSLATIDAHYWADFIQVAVPLCLADRALLVELEATADEDKRHWREMASVTQPLAIENKSWLMQQPWFNPLLNRAWLNSFSLSEPVAEYNSAILLVVKLIRPQPTLLILTIAAENQSRMSESLLRAQLIADVAAFEGHEINLPDTHANKQEHIIQLLSLLVQVQASHNYQEACYTLINGLVGHSPEIDQAVLGWREGDYIRIKTLSHYDKFEKKTDSIKLFEAALEECFDQQTPIDYPAERQTTGLITLAHKQLQLHLGVNQLFTLPIYNHAGQPVGVITLINSHGGFSRPLLEAVAFVTGLLAETLIELKRKNELWIVRAMRSLRDLLAVVVGRKYIWTKFFVITLSALLLWGIIGTLPHRITGVAQLATDSTQLISAPFDGTLTQVYATTGDEVDRGALLARLDTQEMLLQMTEMQAEMQRHQSEVDKARATFKLVESEIAQARVRQMQARLDRLNFQLNQAEINAPFPGVVVEGERKELLGLPLRKGQILYRIARIEGLYLVIEVPQEDIDYIHIGSVGEFSLVTQPNIAYPFEITHILPVARVKGAKGAHFEMKARLTGEPETWWRSGMTGVAKIDAGRAQVLWLLGHRLVDRLRLIFWW